MHRGNIADKLHDDYRLAHAGTAIGTNLTALGKRGNQVNHLETGLQHLSACLLLCKRGRRPMNRPVLVGFNLAKVIQRFPHNVKQTPQGSLAHRYRQRRPGIHCRGTPLQPIGR